MDLKRLLRWKRNRRSWRTQRKEEEAREAFDVVVALFCLALITHLISSLLE